jgi:hypothetical protein
MIPALAHWNGDRAMTKDTTKEGAVAAQVLLFDNWFDAIEDGARALCADLSREWWRRILRRAFASAVRAA